MKRKRPEEMQKRELKNMTEGKPVKLMLSFALPLMLGNVCQQLYTVTDTAIVGRGVGLEALAALGSVDWLGFLLFGTAQGFTQGFSIKMSQQYGAGNFSGLKKTIGVSAVLSAVIAVLSTFLGLLLLPGFLRLLAVPGELYEMAYLYMAILFGGVITALFYNFCASSLRAVGNSRTPLVAMIVSSVTNIALDSFTVFVMKWGIAGAAGATVFSQLVAGTVCFRKMQKTPELKITKDAFTHDLPLEKSLLALGFPVSAQNVAISVGGLLVMRVVNSFGTAFIAGYTAASKLYGILEIAAISYSYAVTTFVGQNYGAKLFRRVKTGTRQAAGMSILTAAVTGAIIILLRRPVTGIFISAEDPSMALLAQNAAVEFITWMASCLPILYLLYVYRSALQGIGKTAYGLVSAVLELGARLLCAYIASLLLIGSLLFVAEVFAWTMGALVVFVAWEIFMKKLPAND